ncbi:unnamed protein product, partial [Allacma fusca]
MMESKKGHKFGLTRIILTFRYKKKFPRAGLFFEGGP